MIITDYGKKSAARFIKPSAFLQINRFSLLQDSGKKPEENTIYRGWLRSYKSENFLPKKEPII